MTRQQLDNLARPLGWAIEPRDVWLMEEGLSGYCAIGFHHKPLIVHEFPTLQAVKQWLDEQTQNQQQLAIKYEVNS